MDNMTWIFIALLLLGPEIVLFPLLYFTLSWMTMRRMKAWMEDKGYSTVVVQWWGNRTLRDFARLKIHNGRRWKPVTWVDSDGLQVSGIIEQPPFRLRKRKKAFHLHVYSATE